MERTWVVLFVRWFLSVVLYVIFVRFLAHGKSQIDRLYLLNSRKHKQHTNETKSIP